MKPGDHARWLNDGAYPGGKGAVYQRLISVMPPHDVYIEPFLGGGAVLRNKRPARVNIGIDLDLDVIERWRSRAAAPSEAAALPDAPLDSATEPGRRRVSLNSPAVAAAAKSGGSGSIVAGIGGARSSSRVASFSDDAQPRFQFFCEDGIRFLRTYRFSGREVVYCDPPYLHSTRRDTDLYEHELTAARHAELLRVLQSLPCSVLISGYASGLYDRMLGDWHTFQFQAMTRRGPAIEHVWHNYPLPVALHDYRYLGANRRERERIKRKEQRWSLKLARMPILERQALLSALARVADTRAGTDHQAFLMRRSEATERTLLPESSGS
jgi:DNA adenine methylase